MAVTLMLNGKLREFATLNDGVALSAFVEELGLKADRVAVEHNGQIVARGVWQQEKLREGDKVEIVHFVGGGSEWAR